MKYYYSVLLRKESNSEIVLKTYIYILGLNGTILFKRNNIEYGLQKTYYSFRGTFNDNEILIRFFNALFFVTDSCS